MIEEHCSGRLYFDARITAADCRNCELEESVTGHSRPSALESVFRVIAKLVHGPGFNKSRLSAINHRKVRAIGKRKLNKTAQMVRAINRQIAVKPWTSPGASGCIVALHNVPSADERLSV
ncbi:hypothetical protein KM043_007885 [Ampulex compressa]|nr:hypothetical protein KM043_007885 [Ampulex compressa]